MEKKLFKCEVCGQILEEGQLEDKCPKCGAAREKFHEMNEEDTAKSIRSEKTNDLHARLIDLTNTLEALADAGIEDNLDPSCVNIFKRAKANANFLRRLARAEIAGHIAKGKW